MNDASGCDKSGRSIVTRDAPKPDAAEANLDRAAPIARADASEQRDDRGQGSMRTRDEQTSAPRGRNVADDESRRDGRDGRTNTGGPTRSFARTSESRMSTPRTPRLCACSERASRKVRRCKCSSVSRRQEPGSCPIRRRPRRRPEDPERASRRSDVPSAAPRTVGARRRGRWSDRAAASSTLADRGRASGPRRSPDRG